MKVLLDNGILSHAEFLVGSAREDEVNWGGKLHAVDVVGYRRKPALKDENQQSEMEALFTVGRLIRENKIHAFSYIELVFEKIRGRGRIQECNALKNCKFGSVEAPLDRSKLFQTSMGEFIEKGDRKFRDSSFTQIGFVKWLFSLEDRGIELLKKHSAQIGFSQFEQESLSYIPQLQKLCQHPITVKDYPDLLHIWTAERNKLNYFLTLDKKFKRKFSEVNSRMNVCDRFHVNIVTPIEFLHLLEIKQFDPVPVEHNRFYFLNEVSGL